jgi:4-diphosphocytidyl-2-C-methyl-D-erythritol kinase
MSRSVVLRPFAKINLRLQVGARRPDGFHDVQTVLQAIALGDTLHATGRSGPFALAARAPGVPSDRTNLVWRAAAELWRALGRSGDPRDAHVRLAKQIPPAAGLGGGSADAAAALVALNTIWNGRLARRDLIRIAAGIGADVPFFLAGGTAVGLGLGDEIYPVDDVTRQNLLIVKPSFGIATADAYRWLDEDRADRDDVFDAPEAGRELDVGWPAPIAIANDLEPPVARRHPEIAAIIEACQREGARAAVLSGSGSAVFAVFSEEAIRRAARRLQRPDRLVVLSRTLSRRESARRMGL